MERNSICIPFSSRIRQISITVPRKSAAGQCESQGGQYSEGDQQCADDSGERCGSGREGENPVQCIAEQRAEGPLGLSRRPGFIVKWNPFCIKTDERENPFHIAVVFLQLQYRVRHGAVHHSEISSAVTHFQTAHPANDFIECAGQQITEAPLPGAVFAQSCAAVVSFCADDAVHLFQECGRVLKVRIHENAVVTGSIFQTGVHRCLFAEIP